MLQSSQSGYPVPPAVDLSNHHAFAVGEEDDTADVQMTVETDLTIRDVKEQISLEDIQVNAENVLSSIRIPILAPDKIADTQTRETDTQMRRTIVNAYMRKIALQRDQCAEIDATNITFNHWYATYQFDHGIYLGEQYRDTYVGYEQFKRLQAKLIAAITNRQVGSRVTQITYEVPVKESRTHGWTPNLPGEQTRQDLAMAQRRFNPGVETLSEIGMSPEEGSDWWLRGCAKWLARWTRIVDPENQGWSSSLFRSSYKPWRLVLYPPSKLSTDTPITTPPPASLTGLPAVITPSTAPIDLTLGGESKEEKESKSSGVPPPPSSPLPAAPKVAAPKASSKAKSAGRGQKVPTEKKT